ncbi:MAG: Imm21 family immunity protein [Micromonospora sp.]
MSPTDTDPLLLTGRLVIVVVSLFLLVFGVRVAVTRRNRHRHDDLATALAATRRPANQLPWIESAGGPLIIVPTTALAHWRGASDGFYPDDVDSWDDYWRACEVDGYAGTIPVGDAQALVLGDEPASTTYLPERRLFVRWIYAESEADVIRLIPKALEMADWEDAGDWITDGPATLFDSALAGDEAKRSDHLRIEVGPGTYQIRTAYVEPENRTALALVHLADQVG